MSDREILFRGKNKKDDWVTGYYTLVSTANSGLVPAIVTDTEIGCINPQRIDPKTRGEFTGLTDKNGTKIFEGDIVELYFFDKTRRNGELIEVKNTKRMAIEWFGTSFYMREIFRNYRLDKEMGVINEVIFDYKGERIQGVYKSNSVYFVEVIGNIHDNPELMRGE